MKRSILYVPRRPQFSEMANLSLPAQLCWRLYSMEQHSRLLGRPHLLNSEAASFWEERTENGQCEAGPVSYALAGSYFRTVSWGSAGTLCPRAHRALRTRCSRQRWCEVGVSLPQTETLQRPPLCGLSLCCLRVQYRIARGWLLAGFGEKRLF